MNIMKLQFDWDTNDEEGTSQIAETPFGIYSVDTAPWLEQDYYVSFNGHSDEGYTLNTEQPQSREIAMQLTQQDFERRILLCIQE